MHHLEVREEESAEYFMYHVPARRARPLLMKVMLSEVEEQVEVDTGATVSPSSARPMHHH